MSRNKTRKEILRDEKRDAKASIRRKNRMLDRLKGASIGNTSANPIRKKTRTKRSKKLVERTRLSSGETGTIHSESPESEKEIS